MANAIDPVVLVKCVSDVRQYGFDFRWAPEVWDGQTVIDALASGVSSVSPAGLTVGALSTLSSAFDDIPAGAGLKAVVSGGTAGTTYNFSVAGTTAAGRVLVIPCQMVVVADHS